MRSKFILIILTILLMMWKPETESSARSEHMLQDTIRVEIDTPVINQALIDSLQIKKNELSTEIARSKELTRTGTKNKEILTQQSIKIQKLVNDRLNKNDTVYLPLKDSTKKRRWINFHFFHKNK